MTNDATASCLFCKIASGQIPSKIAYTDESCIAFHDISPQAPVHLLIIPRKHFASPLDAEASDETLIGHLHRVAADLARKLEITSGFRLIVNAGADAGQTVFHLHLHLLGGRPMRWPPG
jgi:histidine triad (HIT) family protein